MNADPTITPIDGGFRLAIGPWSIVDVRTECAAHDVLNMLGTFKDLPSMTGADLAMLAGYTPIICIGAKYKRLSILWGRSLTIAWQQLPQPATFSEPILIDPFALWLQGVNIFDIERMMTL